MTSKVLWVVGLAALFVSVAALPAAAASERVRVFDAALVGVPEGMTGSPGAIRTVNGAGAPWVSEGRARLDSDGRLRVEVRGLLLAGGFTNPVANVAASLTCEGSNVVATTAGVPMSPDGDADIDQVIALPTTCVGPIVLIRIVGATGPGSWIAATGFIGTPRLKAHAVSFDPDHTGIITSEWRDGAGLRDPRGDDAEGLVLAKGGGTATNAAAVAFFTGVRGLTLSRLGFDFQDGGHCGAGAPRYNAFVDMDGDMSTPDGRTFFFGCASGTQGNVPGASGWRRVRFADDDASPADGTSAWPGFGTAVLRALSIVFDEGTDGGTGSVVLDNLFVNFRYVTQARGSDRPVDEPFRSAVVGLPAGMTGSAGTIRGVAGGGLPWAAEGTIRVNEKLRADVQGLLLTAGPLTGTIGPVRGVRASLTCAGTDTVASTDVARLNARGDAKIRDRFDAPAICVGPIVLIRIGATAADPGPLLGPWIAASGFGS